MAARIRVKRVYDPPTPRDGRRVLVDRLWPRGISRTSARIDAWMKEIAPSNDLRTWFHHEPDKPGKWTEFARRYRAELTEKGVLLEDLRAVSRKGAVTLLFASRNEEHNNATVLRDLLEKKGKGT